MASNISTVDAYLDSGCGRSSLWNPPRCKMHGGRRKLTALRATLLDCGLTETLKWSVPCYTSGNRNIIPVFGPLRYIYTAPAGKRVDSREGFQ